ncbi:uncharacterized protein LOC123009175 [Tribolium madens]|uniref:uncharacterized protein LOC123009175 n=1 Tax=Tribolium madens TaxID=41895 RepID=UPI001CF75FB0|nr:uncharacterized protein LOC123009175 [Tribolium madens]
MDPQKPESDPAKLAATLKKFLTSKPYDEDDITETAKKIFSELDQNFDQFKLVTLSDDLPKILPSETPIYAIFEKLKQKWVIFCIIETKIFYKDSSGEKMPYRLEKQLKILFPEAEIIANLDQDHGDEEVENYGPFCLRNLRILLNSGKEIDPKQKFCQLSDVNSEKIEIVLKMAQDFEKNDDFKKALSEFIDSLPLELGSGMLNYKKILEEELDKDEKDVDHDRIKKAREEYLKPENIDKLHENYKISDTEVEIKILKKFPEEMDKLGEIFLTLDFINDETQLNSALEQLSTILSIDDNKLKSFYEFKTKKNEQKNPKLTPDDITQIADNLPIIKQKHDKTTPFDEILSQITLGKDLKPSSPTQYTPKKSQLEQNYYLVKTKYQNLSWSSIQDVNFWAIAKKGHLGETLDEICETIAISDRVYFLLSGGNRLRDTQILAILLFFQNDQGRLCEIKTGEGKTIIVSILAVIKALQGHLVDVITTSPVLANEGVAQTRSFYSIFGVTVSSNDLAVGYTADVVYGSINSFQFDYLKDSFERRFGQVILDEVDSLLVDNGGHIAKIATPFPGMENLRYIFIKIWQELHKAEESFIEENQEKILTIVTKPQDEAWKLLDDFFNQNERKIIMDKIRATNPSDNPLIPPHLIDYVHDNLDNWIESALIAKYDCHLHQQYRIVDGTITPVDNLNTGVTLKNTVWSNGLQQFLQLKHNLHLTCVTLPSIFISNIGYIKNYQNIFGVTGTLGSTTEQDLLSTIYNVTFSKIPTYKPKIFEENPPIVTNDWDIEVTAEIVKKIDENRAVLAIFETEQDLINIEQNLKIIQNGDFRLRIFAKEEEAQEMRNKVQVGDVILATNLAGRGCDFRTEEKLEENGGLHVLVGFLPCNLRVEEQAFGRTSRQGKKGSAQLIIRGEHNGTEIKNARDELEAERLKHVRDVVLKEISFKERLVKLFSDLYLKVKRLKVLQGEFQYFLQDLKEFWAFWLDKNNFSIRNMKNSPEEEFLKFVIEAHEIINGEIKHNPYYSIALADYYLENNKKNKARLELQHAIAMSDNHSELLAGAHMKLFEVAIASGNQTWEKIKKALAKVLFINVQKNTQYKKNALTQLNQASNAVTLEIDYIENFLKNPDFEKILHESENKFLKHIYSRLYCLKTHKGNIDELVKQIEETEDDGVDFSGKAQSTVDNHRKIDENSVVTEIELSELQSVGLDALYALRRVKDVPDYVIYAAQAQIGGGITALAAGLFFPPIFPIMSPLGVTLISEGIIDIVFSLFEDNPEFKDFMKGKAVSYGIALVTFGISAIAQSIKILTKALSFFRKLATFLRKSPYLKQLCSRIANLVDKWGNSVEKLLEVAKFNKLTKSDQLRRLKELQKSGKAFDHLGGLKKLKSLEKLQKVGKLRELTRSQLLVQFAKDVAWETGKQGGKRLLNKFVVKPLIAKIFGELIEKIKRLFVEALKKSIKDNRNLREKIRTTEKSEIDKTLDEFIGKEDKALKKLKKFVFDTLGKFNSTTIDVLTLSYDTAVNLAEIGRICSKFASNLEKKLKGGSENNKVDEMIEKICAKLADKLLSLSWDVLKDNVKFAWKHKDIFSSKKQTTGVVLKPNTESGKNGKEDSWKIFGLAPGASLTEVRKHYKKMALILHPDKNLNDPAAVEKFQRFQNAYEDILKTFEKGKGKGKKTAALETILNN